MFFVVWAASIGVGILVVRLLLKKVRPTLLRALLLSLFCAIFFAPVPVHLGHGAYIPIPVLSALETAFSERDFGPVLSISSFAVFFAVFSVSFIYFARRRAHA